MGSARYSNLLIAEKEKPTMIENKELIEKLEELVDRSDLSRVLLNLSEICMLKAEHIETNWQDKRAAAKWLYASGQISAVEERISRK